MLNPWVQVGTPRMIGTRALQAARIRLVPRVGPRRMVIGSTFGASVQRVNRRVKPRDKAQASDWCAAAQTQGSVPTIARDRCDHLLRYCQCCNAILATHQRTTAISHALQ